MPAVAALTTYIFFGETLVPIQILGMAVCAGAVFIVTMDRPEARNAVNPEQARRLREAFAQFERNEAAKVAVLTGANGVFCAGYDLKSLSGRGIGETYDPEGEGPTGPYLHGPHAARVTRPASCGAASGRGSTSPGRTR